MTVIALEGRLVVVRTAEQVEAHRNDERRRRLNAASRHVRAQQRALRLKRTASWANLAAISEIYNLAERMTRRTGIPHEVDHIIPMLGRLVSGLHVEANLRVVTKDVNRAKSNRFDEEQMVGGAGFEPATPSV